jgi:hypothetical protein
MTEKIVRGQLIVFTADPKDPDGNSISPDSVKLYVNYIHESGTSTTDEIDMDYQTDGTWVAEFDTKVANAGQAFASVRATNPAAAEDFKFTITANIANPVDESTA